MGPSLYDIAKPLLFSLPPETAHETTVRGLEAAQGTPVESLLRDRLTVTVNGTERAASGVSSSLPAMVPSPPTRCSATETSRRRA
jgi:dihydroorotate dehydrogenase